MNAQINKLPTTNSNAYRAAIRTYLADATEVEDNENATEDERIAYMIDRFRSEYGHEIARHGTQTAAQNWLQGLAINVEYMDHDIPDTVAKLHGMDNANDFTERLRNACVTYWWSALAVAVAREVQNSTQPA